MIDLDFFKSIVGVPMKEWRHKGYPVSAPPRWPDLEKMSVDQCVVIRHGTSVASSWAVSFPVKATKAKPARSGVGLVNSLHIPTGNARDVFGRSNTGAHREWPFRAYMTRASYSEFSETALERVAETARKCKKGSPERVFWFGDYSDSEYSEARVKCPHIPEDTQPLVLSHYIAALLYLIGSAHFADVRISWLLDPHVESTFENYLGSLGIDNNNLRHAQDTIEVPTYTF